LALLLNNKGDYAEAELLYRRALAIIEKALSACKIRNHPQRLPQVRLSQPEALAGDVSYFGRPEPGRGAPNAAAVAHRHDAALHPHGRRAHQRARQAAGADDGSTVVKREPQRGLRNEKWMRLGSTTPVIICAYRVLERE
jgi:hypothetical protein